MVEGWLRWGVGVPRDCVPGPEINVRGEPFTQDFEE